MVQETKQSRIQEVGGWYGADFTVVELTVPFVKRRKPPIRSGFVSSGGSQHLEKDASQTHSNCGSPTS